MSDNHKYYYIRLKENFFDSDEIKLLESIPNVGYKYSNILLKMYLKSLKYNGKLMFNDRIPFNKEMLSIVVGHSVGDVKDAIEKFEKFGLIETLDSGEIYMLDIQNFIGKTSTEADRIKAYRSKIDNEKNKSVQMYNERTPEIEIDIDIELEKELDKDKENMSGSKEQDNIPYKEIVDYLNEKTGKNFKVRTDATRRVIKARFAEKNTLADFKKVIDIKSAEWRNDEKMQRYLQPSTLFGTKFEGYLNQSVGIKNNSQDIRNMSSEDISKLSEREIAEKWMGKDWVR